MQAAALSRKRSKSKKHKKERKKRRSSPSSSEDQRKEDMERHRGSTRDKSKHVRSTRPDCPRSSRDIMTRSGKYKNSEGESRKAKSEVNKDSRGRERSSVKDSSSEASTSTSRTGSRSQIPKAPAKDLGRRRSSSSEPGKSAAEAEEKRKKRRASKEDDHPVDKRRSSKEPADVRKEPADVRKEPADVRKEPADDGKQERLEIVEKGCRRPNEERVAEWKSSGHEKIQSQHTSKRITSSLTPDIRRKTEDKGLPESPSSSSDKPLTPSSSASSSLKISFKIPKKSSLVKVETSWRNAAKSPLTSKTSKIIDSPAMKVTPEHTRLRSTRFLEVPSPVPSPVPCYASSPVQLEQSSRMNETRSSSNASVEHSSCPDVSTESTGTTNDDFEMQIAEELHLARSNKQLHTNVEKSYGELTSMDVDPATESSTIALGFVSRISQKQYQDLLIVLDTNVLLSHLDFVKKIRSHGLGALGFPTLLVPWVVLQELDSLKSGKLSKNVERKARPAVDYIYTSLKNQEPRLWGQSMQQVSQAACGLKAENNDDRVLQCCLQYKMLYPEGTIMLCTNDKNLCSKALLSGIQASSKADLQEQAEVDPELLHQRYGHTSASPHHSAPFKPPQEVVEAEKAERSCGEVEESRRKETERELSECVSLLESSLQSALSAVLEEEMEAAYEELWLEIVYVKPPWSLEALLQCFEKHWIAVFGAILRRSLINCVKTLSSFFRTNVSVKYSSFLNAVSTAEELLTALRHRSPYSGHVDSSLTCLKNLRNRLQAKTPKSPDDDRDSDIVMADTVEDVAQPSQVSPQEVWALFESIWHNLCNFSSAVFKALGYSPDSVDSVEPCSMSPPQDPLSCLHRLHAAVEQLLEAFQRLLSVGSTVEDAQALLTFIHTSKITAVEPRFTAEDLFECLSHQEYREKLSVGGTQLMGLRGKLHQCAATICNAPSLL